MSKAKAPPVIRLRGVRQNNLKNFDLDVPLRQLVVITGLSGSGKSSLAFDTLFAEGQRRYIETFSPYARQFFDRMDKPRVDSIEGIPPAIAIEQRNAVRSTRSTVGTMTEICDYLKLLWPHIAKLHCRSCGQPVRREPPQVVWESLTAKLPATTEVLVTFTLPLSEKLPLEESLALLARQGYQRVLLGGAVLRLEEVAAHKAELQQSLVVVQDRVRLAAANRARFVEACEQAYHFGKGRLQIVELRAGGETQESHPFSAGFHCATCDLDHREPTPALFSFNHPTGACPACKGFGRIITIDYNLALPDRSMSLAAGAIKPWRTGTGAESQADLAKFCKKRGVRMDVPFNQLPKEQQDWVIDGDAGYDSNDPANSWPRKWYGIKGYFRWLESKSYKMHVRVLLSRYRAYTTCPQCHGKRFQPEALAYTFDGGGSSISLADFYALSTDEALKLVETIAAGRPFGPRDPIALVLEEVKARLGYLVEAGLGYLTLDRATRTLSGGETERVNLTTCLGTRLVNTLFVLDEPSVGLHARDTDRLVRILQRLRDRGNTVVVVEHEASVMRAANQLIDLGPGHGESGGQLVFQGSYADILKHTESLTGQYLAGRQRMGERVQRPVQPGAPALQLTGATRHNLENLSVQIPLRRFVSLTGVSGSGKTTLVREVLLPALLAKLQSRVAIAKASERIEAETESSSDEEAEGEAVSSAALAGWEQVREVVLVDQAPLGRTPRSNPAVYIGAFDFVRDLFADSELAKQRGLNSSTFSFNSAQGQCERCRGAGFEKIEMQFLSDVFTRCPDCDGRRYRSHILEVKISAPRAEGAPVVSKTLKWSIGDLLEATVDEVIVFLAGFSASRAAQRAGDRLKLLQEVGLGYLRLGQPINTLSGGECQRLKLVGHLAEASATQAEVTTLTTAATVEDVKAWAKQRKGHAPGKAAVPSSTSAAPSTLFLFDEPTTGLHFEDVRILLQVFQRLVDAGHSVLVIEHNLDVIKSSDWVIDLGPEAGAGGGKLVVAGPPEEIMKCAASHTGRALRDALKS